jgi:antitoxin ParD1/3/4
MVKEKMSILPNFAIAAIGIHMSTMNISLPDHLKSFVDEQVAGRGYGTSSEYIRELIRRDQDRLVLRGLLVDGASSVQSDPADGRYFTELRDRVRGRHSK